MALICFSALSCEKEPTTTDYRDGWVGSYNYNGENYSWLPTGYSPTTYFTGSLTVNAYEDSCVRIQLCDSTAEEIVCKVGVDGSLKLVGNQYRGFRGNFFDADSLYFYCTNYTPGAGNAKEYHCKSER